MDKIIFLGKGISVSLSLFLLFFAVFAPTVEGQDSDNDAVPDIVDIDDDNDGIIDVNELLGCTATIRYEFYDLVPLGNTVDNIPTTGFLASGSISDFDVNALQSMVDPGDTGTFSIRYYGLMFISTPDIYTFYTASDDGSKLLVDGIEIVSNDGLHGNRERNGMVTLAQGTHTIEVLFFENTGRANLSVSYESSSIPKTSLPFSIFILGPDCDFDGDGVTNGLDLDSDNDGIPDNVEAQPTATYQPRDITDSDLNGLADIYESVPGAGEGIVPVNTTSATYFDFMELDSDNDGIPDSVEAGITLANSDSDGDGLDDAIDTTNAQLPGALPDYSDPNGAINTPRSLPNLQNQSNLEVDYRDATVDSDNDTVTDDIDVDDDNDGVLDLYENCSGQVSYEFYDISPPGNTVDNIPTSGALATGEVDSFDVDVLQNLVDLGDGDNYSIRYSGLIYIDADDTYTFYTSSDDGSKLFIDGVQVVNNDFAHGIVERSGTITLTEGFYAISVLFFERTGGDFLSVSYESSTVAKTNIPFSILFSGKSCDTDTDLIFNELDLDADGDGCNDAIEAYGTLSADPDEDGYYGVGVPTVNADGSVVGASYQKPVDIDSNSIYDFLEVNTGIPSITSQPLSVATCSGCSASFSVTSNADTYQWQRYNGSVWEDLVNGPLYSGVSSNVLTVNKALGSENGRGFRAALFNSSTICPIFSDAATLTLGVNNVVTNRGITYRIKRE